MVQNVVVIAEDGVLPFELGIPGRVLGTAKDASGAPAYTVSVCSLDDAPVLSDGGFTVTPSTSIAALASADVVIVAPSARYLSLSARTGAERLRAHLEIAPAHTRIAAICIGSFALAATGALDGRVATTHWLRAGEFAEAFPLVRLDSRALYVTDGRYTTSAGAAAGLDMLLHLVRDDHGSESANRVARLCVVPSWREGGQQQFVAAPLPEHREDSVGAVLDWATEHLAQPLSLDELAERAHMSRRTFTRKVRNATGMSAGEWLLRQRLELAKRLLETSDSTVDVIAHESGLGSGSNLRKHLQACAGISPSAYRQSFHT